MTVRILLNTVFIFSFICVLGQDYEVEDTYEEQYGPKYMPFLTFRNVLLAGDYLMGLEAGAINPARNLTLFTSFDFRPFRKKILNHQGGNLFYQHAEQRFFVGLGAEFMKPAREKNYGVFVQINSSYTWAYYGGTEEKPPGGFVFNPKAGVFWQPVPSLFLKAGYAYQDTKNKEVEPHRLYLAVAGIITKK